MNYKTRIKSYIKNVLKEPRTCGKYEFLAVKRHEEDKKNLKGYYFDEAAGLKACNFFNLLKHWKGDAAGEQIILEGWEAFIVYAIFGWKKKTGVRRFNYADVVVARKNGKTTLASGIALYMMVADGESGAEIYSAGVDRGQAAICWESSYQIAQKSPLLSQMITFYKHSIFTESLASSYKPLSRDSKNKDGLNPHCAICDERHAWPTNEIFNVIKSGMGARSQPLVFSITTAGFDTAYPYFKQYGILKQILEGNIKQENQFAVIYEMDKDDDWKDEKSWKKANPNLGVSVSLDYMRNEFREAQQKGGENEVNFKTKNLNMWVDAPEVWIPDEKVAACDLGVSEMDLLGKQCYAGFDFASHVDIVALALFFPTEKAIKMFFWIPEEKMREQQDIVDYRLWKEQGYLSTTPGDMIDIDYIVSDICKIAKRYRVKNFAFDPYKMYHGVIQGLYKEGLSEIMDEFPQSIKYMSEPTKELERLILTKEVDLMQNPVLRWMFKNVVLYRDPNSNIKLDKGKSVNKIDGVVAIVDALGGYMSINDKSEAKEIYTNHSFRSIRTDF